MKLDLTKGARQDLLIAAQQLYDNGDITDVATMISFFEKPWKWAEEVKELEE